MCFHSLYILAHSLVTLISCSPVHSTSKYVPVVTNSSNGVSFHGDHSNGIESFQNIRFGQDTSGNNRFAHPKPFIYPNDAVVNASAPGQACPQQRDAVFGYPSATGYSEDCLTLRVDRVSNTSSEAKLPVMLWIFGGGDAIGTIYDPLYDPTALLLGAAEKKMPVIFAAVNYRVDVFGFAASPALNATDSINSGLLDQRLGMEWVKQNIALFGGDPDKITIFGESSGANSVGLHITAYGGDSSHPLPFTKAIMESGGPTGPIPGATTNISAFHTAQLTAQVNCTSITGDSDTELACLRALPLDTLLENAIEYGKRINPLQPGFQVFDVTAYTPYIPNAPSQLLKQGRFSKNIDVITGWNENDGSIFVPAHTTRTECDLITYLNNLLPGLTNDSIQEVLSLYPTASFPSDPGENVTAQYFRAAAMNRDMSFTCPSLLLAQAMANYSSPSFSPSSSSSSLPFYDKDRATKKYIFVLNQTAYTPIQAKENELYLGVQHTSDIPYVFNDFSTTQVNTTESNRLLGSKISGSWIEFAYYGSPTGIARKGWQMGNETLALTNWLPGAVKGGDGNGFDVRIIGGPRDGMERIGRGAVSANEIGWDHGHGGSSGCQSGNGVSPLPVYGEDQAKRCAFWNSDTITAQVGV